MAKANNMTDIDNPSDPDGYTVVTTNTYSIGNTTNHSNGTGTAYERNETLAKAEIAVLGTILYLALFGNLIVIIVLLYRKRKLSRMQMFIIHLAIADISVALFQVLPQLVMDITNRFDGNNFLCKLTKYMQVATMYSSTYVLIMTALDRYMSICHPLTSQTWTTRRVHLMVLIAWILSGLFSIPQLIIFSYGKSPYNEAYDCIDNFDFENAYWELQAYVLWIFVSVYAIPFVILTVCYSKICHVVWISVNAKENHSNSGKQKKYLNKSASIQREIRKPRAHSKKMSKSKIKTVKLTLTVVLCFIICWAPFFITQMWSAFDLNAPYYTSHIMAIATLLASLNSCTNPWIYLAFSGRLCKRQKRPRSKTTWMSSVNTYTTEAGETMRMRKITSDSTSFTRSFDDKDVCKAADDV
ncbi:annetocin receptor-like [Mercenaria mercenaria]|uniref:annetocin receptor-like n=1 Tax=Mercenaria mercenaria TaxID=6596 RepID=UPI001E1D4450|nr:annetocin receptor-like [Mercenaria mercenaria]XP_045179670.1 annetocin receptor-like [Mercenaria mercenaria]XP_045179671.1 annetocin receptor-like [Mercenaria mercenaria]